MKSLKLGGQLAVLSLVGLMASEIWAQQPTGRRTTTARQAKHVLHNLGNNVSLASDGRLFGVAATVDPETLETIAAANVEVVFVQQGRIVTQARTAPNGQFVVSGLNPHVAYSVIARSIPLPPDSQDDFYSEPLYGATSVIVLPAASQQARDELDDLEETHFTNQQNNAANSLTVMLASARDMALVRQPPMAQPADVGPPGGPGLGLGAGGGAGGGGGGGGGGIIGIGLGAAALAVALASDRSGRTIIIPVSPFVP